MDKFGIRFMLEDKAFVLEPCFLLTFEFFLISKFLLNYTRHSLFSERCGGACTRFASYPGSAGTWSLSYSDSSAWHRYPLIYLCLCFMLSLDVTLRELKGVAGLEHA